MYKAILSVCVLITFLSLTGCWDRTEIERIAYVIAIGADQGENGQMVVTYQIAKPEAGAASLSSGEPEATSDIISITAPDFIAARDLANSFTSRNLIFTHTKVLVLSEEVARTDKLIEYLSPSIRDREFDRKINILISRERAEDFIRNNQPTLETRPHKFFELLTRGWQDTGLVPDATLDEFLHRLEEGAGLFLATYGTTEIMERKPDGDEDEYIAGEIDKEGGNPTQTIGSAVIKDGKMIGVLDGENTRLSLLLRPIIESATMIVTYPDPLAPDHHITARVIKEERTGITVSIDDNQPSIDVIVPLVIEILSIPSHIDYVEDLKKVELLKDSIEQSIEEKINQLVNKTQLEYKADPFRWSLIARRNFWTYNEYKAYNWMSKYPKAHVNIDVQVEIKEFGKQLKPPNASNKRDDQQ